MNLTINRLRHLSLFLALGLPVTAACSGGSDTIGTGSSSGASSSGASSSGASSSGSGLPGSGSGGGSGTGGGGSSAQPGGDGPACSSSDDCEPLDCSCSDGSITSYRGCSNGRCETRCPSGDRTGGSSCVVPGGCFCASGACEFSTQLCCASPGTLKSGAACSSDCDCTSGTCSFGKCF